MITQRKHDARHYELQDRLERWQTFNPRVPAEPIDHGPGTLANIHELRIPPEGQTVPRLWAEAEILTYVYRGAIVHEDSTGVSAVKWAGAFQHMRTGRRVRYLETNASGTEWAHVFQIFLQPYQVGACCASTQRRFTSAERRNRLCLVASADGRQGSLCIEQDAFIFSSELDQGHHLVHELAPERSVWLHIVCGEVTLGEVTLTQGDGAGVAGESVVSLTARTQSEILLVDVSDPLLGLHDPAVP